MLSLEFSGWHADQKFKGCCKRFYKYFVHTKLRAMCQKQRFIYMVTGTHAQLQGDEITEDLFVCDSIQSNLNNFCSERHAAKARKTKAENYAETM